MAGVTTTERPGVLASSPQTTDAGIPVESDEYSLTVGAGGPILLQDSYLIEQMASFNRERIPERQPHPTMLTAQASYWVGHAGACSRSRG
jgi:catalase